MELLTEESQRLQLREIQLKTQLHSEQYHNAEKLKLQENAKNELKIHFQNLANQIFDDKSCKLSNLNRENLENILTPFSRQLEGLKKEINEIYISETRERTSLKSEILQLRDLNQQLNTEAGNLVNALKGNSKTQGDWGELVLEKLLETSGLRKGIEYSSQMGVQTETNRQLRPDVVLHLPDGKDIVIDSKVSLVHWEKYSSTDDEKEKRSSLKSLLLSIKRHASELSEKNYPKTKQLHSLDFVLMFIPIEAAFAAVCNYDKGLIPDTLKKNVIIVTPTTLLATLRTVQNIWQFDQQSRNSMEIARRAGIMYDKFRGFLEDLEKIGKQLTIAQNSYGAALLKLTQGRGNLISQADQLKKLGVQAKKDLPKTITQTAEIEEQDVHSQLERN